MYVFVRIQPTPASANLLVQGDNGAGIGASHQTGWTALVSVTIARRKGVTLSVRDGTVLPDKPQVSKLIHDKFGEGGWLQHCTKCRDYVGSLHD